MKTILRLGYLVAVAVVAGPALAVEGGGVNVTTVVGDSCEFTSTPPAISEVPPVPGETNIGRLGYTCTFVGSTHLVLSLPDGTNLRNGSNTVLYDVYWGIPPNAPTPGPYQHWFFPTSIAFDWITAPTANTEIGGDFYIKLNATPAVAGTYTSVITYTLSP